ncbi:MAG: DNA translocase FtsK [Gammaproteobacteria bacterium]
MAQATRSRTKEKKLPLTPHISRGLREGALFIFGAIAVYLLLSLVSYQSTDPGWSYSTEKQHVDNAGGIAGAWIADVFLSLFGYLAYILPPMVGFCGWIIYKERPVDNEKNVYHLALRGLGFVLVIASACGLATLHFISTPGSLPMHTGAGGVLGEIVQNLLNTPFSSVGATLFLLALCLTGISLFTGLSWLTLIDQTGRITLDLFAKIGLQITKLRENIAIRRARNERQDIVKIEKEKTRQRQKPRIEPVLKKVEPSIRAVKEKQVPLFKSNSDSDLPALNLLDEPEPTKNNISTAALEAMSRQVELKLQDFGIEVQVTAVHPGPVVTRYELQPAPGVKVSQISNLSKDLARALSAISVRIVEVIPGKSVIGLEIPNEHREIVRLHEILQSEQYDKASSMMPLGLGKDISGHPVVVDLAKMPHLLVAGTTGSGKSVAINAMILSMLYNSKPHDMRMIMIDPKMLELSIYEGIPHLLAPVVTDMKEASNALRWCVAEMERRYALMAALGVRNIANFNRKVKEAADNGNPIPDPLHPVQEDQEVPTLDSLPYVVVIIDELADMMMMVGKKVEELIARLAQKARASGIHLILATQRPSVDVITGLIKANIPTRIAFQVSSKVDSRTILDQMGAEQLLGHGDMLYLPPGTGVPVRVHGAFVDDHEVHKVVQHLKQTGEPDYLEEVLEAPDGDSNGGLASIYGEQKSDVDPLYDQAVRIVTETRKASISGVQRRLKIGYNRAARMVEEMEESGIVGPLESNGVREVLAPPPPPDN